MASRAQLSIAGRLLLGAVALGCGSGGATGLSRADAVTEDGHDALPAEVTDAAAGADGFDGGRDEGWDAGGDALPDAADGDAGDGASPWVAATSGSVFTIFELAITGAGTDRLGALAFAGNTGSFLIAGVPFRGVAYQVSESFGDYDLFTALAVAEDGSDLAIVYFYCLGAELRYAYTESFTLPLALEEATGSCNSRLTPIFLPKVTLPALWRSVDAVDTGTSIEGPGLALTAAGGTMDLLGESWEIRPFGTVDCTGCPGGPWYEIHAMLHRPGAGCFAILYLYPDLPDQVQVSNVLCLPSLEQSRASFNATWTSSLPAPPPG